MKANDKQIGGRHYASGYQHWDFIETHNIPYLEGCASKYLIRHKNKGGEEDIKKAGHFLEKINERAPSKRTALRVPREEVVRFLSANSAGDEVFEILLLLFAEGNPASAYRAYERHLEKMLSANGEVDTRRYFIGAEAVKITKEQIKAARNWLDDIAGKNLPERGAKDVSEMLATYAAHCVKEALAEKDRRIAELMGALAPFAGAADGLPPGGYLLRTAVSLHTANGGEFAWLRIGDFMLARAALEQEKPTEIDRQLKSVREQVKNQPASTKAILGGKFEVE